MSGPPKDITASELVRRLCELPRPSEVVDFPRTGEDGKPVARVRLQVLHEHERQQALKRAWDWCKDKQQLTAQEMNADVVREGMYGSAVAREMLALACVSENPIEDSEKTGVPRYARQFTTGAQVDENLTQDELAALFAAYTIMARRFGPTSSDIETDEELNAWIKRIVEGASAAPLAYRDSSQLVDLLVLLTARTYALSLILESLSSTLPDTLKSELATWGIGTGFYSSQPEDDTDESSSTGSPSPGSGTLLPRSGEPLDIKDAKRLAKLLTG